MSRYLPDHPSDDGEFQGLSGRSEPLELLWTMLVICMGRRVGIAAVVIGIKCEKNMGRGKIPLPI